MVTVCLTSCGRADLLKKTLTSFFKFNTYPISDFLIYDDDPTKRSEIEDVCSEFNVKLLPSKGVRIGQIKAIDILYSFVKTKYIFHLEDDWEFFKSGFIEDSLPILNDRKNIICVWLRAESDTNDHPAANVVYEAGKIKYKLLKRNHLNTWHGFSFNPGLRRLSDYQLCKKYQNIAMFIPSIPGRSEAKIGAFYMKRGYFAAIICGDGYVMHTGEGQGIR